MLIMAFRTIVTMWDLLRRNATIKLFVIFGIILYHFGPFWTSFLQYWTNLDNIGSFVFIFNNFRPFQTNWDKNGLFRIIWVNSGPCLIMSGHSGSWAFLIFHYIFFIIYFHYKAFINHFFYMVIYIMLFWNRTLSRSMVLEAYQLDYTFLFIIF